jgi:ATP-dependent helicase HrpA
MEEEWKFSYPVSYQDLPVSGARDEVISAMRDHQVVVVVGDTGSGKTTQLPKMALEYLQEISSGKGKRKLVGCTQPRRIAAASVAKRVAEEMGVSLGEEVGYQVRFDDVCGKNTVLKFMTDGILLAETQGDVRLGDYGVIIIDEAHERSLNIDFLLGYLKRLLEDRPDLRVIISSATMDAGGFAEFYGKKTPVINVEGRTFPVETRYMESPEDEDMSRCVARCVAQISKVAGLGDVLVFLPGEREIRECAEVLEGKMMKHTEVLPLYARM